MQLETHEIVSRIREIASIMDAEGDIQSLLIAEAALLKAEEQQEEERAGMKQKVKELAEARNAAKKAATRPETVPSVAKHQAMVQRLDNERLALVKSINQADTELANKEGELKKLYDEVAELEAADEADQHPVDSTALRLAIFKGMGFEPVLDKNGRIEKMIIRSQSGDVHCITPGREDSRVLWALAAS